MSSIPSTQYAVQLVGPGKLKLNKSKEVFKPGPYQILAKVECVGLCFSDLKLLKQFDQHPRKSDVARGIEADALAQMPNYVPGSKPTVPGHEVTCRIVAIGEKVKHHKVGERVLVQTDYRDLPTAGSNSAFGYNFEGALQEYVLMDERVVIDHSGERFLIPVPEDLSASAIALVEPWACVEDSYVTEERQTIKKGGKLLIVADAGHPIESIAPLLDANEPETITAMFADQNQKNALDALKRPISSINALAPLPNEAFDDIVYFGANKATIEVLNDKLAGRGIFNIVLANRKIGKRVNIGVGRVHYGMTRWIGTTGTDAAESYMRIPATGEIRANDSVLVVGAGGPMGQMHVIRALCVGLEGVSVVGTDMDDARLDSLLKKADPLAKANKVSLRMVNPGKTVFDEKFTYFALMAPVAPLVAKSILDASDGAIINIFAGIPAPTKFEIDLDMYIAKRCFMFGTSGSTIRDMKIVLEKVVGRKLNTDCSVDAVSGMAGARDGIEAVEKRTLAGKIIVYPILHKLRLIPLTELHKWFPAVAAKLENGQWCRAAEEELLKWAERMG